MRSRLFRKLTVGILCSALSLFAPRAYSQQSTPLVITVIDSLGRYPLANADVIDLTTGRHRLTDEHGQARLTPSEGQLRLRIRQVGYQPLQRTFQPNPSGAAITVAMSRVAYVISPVTATSHCTTTGDSASLSLSVAVLEQLKQGAEKYEQFRRAYPFEATIERRTARVPSSGNVKRVIVAKEKFHSDKWEEPYKPGDIIQYRFGDFTVPILFLSTLADSLFWKYHCFLASGVRWYQGTRAVRLEFSPSSDVDGPDYEGTALLDSATSLLLRVDFHLAKLRRRDAPKRMEGYITFMSPTPFVMVPDTTMGIWWIRDADRGDWGKPDFAQSLHLEELNYRKEKPPVVEKKNGS
jgi:hypothetical protein